MPMVSHSFFRYTQMTTFRETTPVTPEIIHRNRSRKGKLCVFFSCCVNEPPSAHTTHSTHWKLHFRFHFASSKEKRKNAGVCRFARFSAKRPFTCKHFFPFLTRLETREASGHPTEMEGKRKKKKKECGETPRRRESGMFCVVKPNITAAMCPNTISHKIPITANNNNNNKPRYRVDCLPLCEWLCV